MFSFFTGLGAVQNIKNFQGKVMAPLTLSPEDGRGSCDIIGGDCLFDVNLTSNLNTRVRDFLWSIYIYMIYFVQMSFFLAD